MRRVIKIEVSRTRNRSRQELAASVLLFYFKFVCVGVLPVVFLCTMFMPGTHGGQRMVKDDCEPQCGCWESNQSLLEEQSVLQLPSFIYIKCAVCVCWRMCHDESVSDMSVRGQCSEDVPPSLPGFWELNSP